ncbi:hypothetical protein SNEBB_007585 [Seison nebaliae]|nr:hypothetical protein SNEBB_007585 [Seison nebaliae]
MITVGKKDGTSDHVSIFTTSPLGDHPNADEALNELSYALPSELAKHSRQKIRFFIINLRKYEDLNGKISTKNFNLALEQTRLSFPERISTLLRHSFSESNGINVDSMSDYLWETHENCDNDRDSVKASSISNDENIEKIQLKKNFNYVSLLAQLENNRSSQKGTDNKKQPEKTYMEKEKLKDINKRIIYQMNLSEKHHVEMMEQTSTTNVRENYFDKDEFFQIIVDEPILKRKKFLSICEEFPSFPLYGSVLHKFVDFIEISTSNGREIKKDYLISLFNYCYNESLLNPEKKKNLAPNEYSANSSKEQESEEKKSKNEMKNKKKSVKILSNAIDRMPERFFSLESYENGHVDLHQDSADTNIYFLFYGTLFRQSLTNKNKTIDILLDLNERHIKTFYFDRDFEYVVCFFENVKKTNMELYEFNSNGNLQKKYGIAQMENLHDVSYCNLSKIENNQFSFILIGKKDKKSKIFIYLIESSNVSENIFEIPDGKIWFVYDALSVISNDWKLWYFDMMKIRVDDLSLLNNTSSTIISTDTTDDYSILGLSDGQLICWNKQLKRIDNSTQLTSTITTIHVIKNEIVVSNIIGNVEIFSLDQFQHLKSLKTNMKNIHLLRLVEDDLYLFNNAGCVHYREIDSNDENKQIILLSPTIYSLPDNSEIIEKNNSTFSYISATTTNFLLYITMLEFDGNQVVESSLNLDLEHSLNSLLIISDQYLLIVSNVNQLKLIDLHELKENNSTYLFFDKDHFDLHQLNVTAEGIVLMKISYNLQYLAILFNNSTIMIFLLNYSNLSIDFYDYFHYKDSIVQFDWGHFFQPSDEKPEKLRYYIIRCLTEKEEIICFRPKSMKLLEKSFIEQTNWNSYDIYSMNKSKNVLKFERFISYPKQSNLYQCLINSSTLKLYIEPIEELKVKELNKRNELKKYSSIFSLEEFLIRIMKEENRLHFIKYKK